ncbi:Gfo/Idh/MocA family protein [Paenibacillus lemnae]|uniref:Gfo/Idh/MocA family oxidoreductase n=1 Tax=Paenibacillus lemnae TaxID=1330551 RepID=A0A848M607_PAELE|nr:Gfo/Idh/MocA family oxidoreductase [Paenibacillus lemnae]NMO95034.1 Gfo/Idh/MocA family oxidoreductase [Paenibacillus lemnae]
MDKKYRVIVAGCGGMSNTWVEYALQRPDTAIVGLVDLQPQQAANLAARHGLDCPAFTDINEAIADTGANIVFDVTIPASHYGIAMAGLKQGCHVFGEKPLAETFSDCRDIVALSQETGRIQAVMQNRRFDPRIRAFRQLIADDTIGRVGYAGADFFLGPHFGGFREIMDSPLLLDMAIHTFDQARFILGADPVSVYCHEFNPPGSWFNGNAMALCIFEMSDGSVFSYRGSWCAEGVPTSWEASWRVTGERGTAIWDGHNEIYAEAVNKPSLDESGKPSFIQQQNRIEAELPVMDKTGHHGCLEDMFSALKSGTLPETYCGDNQYSMAMVLASLESARTGQKVLIADLMG